MTTTPDYSNYTESQLSDALRVAGTVATTTQATYMPKLVARRRATEKAIRAEMARRHLAAIEARAQAELVRILDEMTGARS